MAKETKPAVVPNQGAALTTGAPHTEDIGKNPFAPQALRSEDPNTPVGTEYFGSKPATFQSNKSLSSGGLRGIAAVLANEALGLRATFASKTDILLALAQSDGFDPGVESLAQIEVMLVFADEGRRTWLGASTERLYVVRDELSQPQPSVEAALPKDRFISGAAIVPGVVVTNGDGLALGGDLPQEPITDHLFVDTSFEREVSDLLLRTMTKP